MVELRPPNSHDPAIYHRTAIQPWFRIFFSILAPKLTFLNELADQRTELTQRFVMTSFE
jgi:hypothetical protein